LADHVFETFLLTWIKSGPVGFEKKHGILTKAIYSPCNDNFVLRGFQRTNKKVGKIVTIYLHDLLKRRPSLGTFGTQLIK
jgi:hypothetical protein